VDVVEERGQTLLVDDTVLVSGQVERTTDFERGFPIHFARAGEDWRATHLLAARMPAALVQPSVGTVLSF
jgi:hypothetical protein